MANEPALLMRRPELAVELTRQGFPISAASLTMLAARDGGPPFAKFMGRTYYRLDHALEWARTMKSETVTRTADLRKGDQAA